MVNYYKTLKVSPKASTAEIKSAYRRLARKHHPDINKNTEKSTKDFALIAKAYEILSNPQERAFYDTQILKIKTNGSIHHTDSVFDTGNFHAQRLRQMAKIRERERHYNEIVDQMIIEERKETIAMQRVIFPTVALFVSTCFVGIFRPTFWTNSEIPGKIILLTLFIIGVLHLIKRLRAGFEKYTYDAESSLLHDSILEDREPVRKPYSRLTAIAFLTIGIGLSLTVGYFIGNYMEMPIMAMMPKLFSPTLQLEFIFYPPIVVLLVDIMHAVASKLENNSENISKNIRS